MDTSKKDPSQDLSIGTAITTDKNGTCKSVRLFFQSQRPYSSSISIVRNPRHLKTVIVGDADSHNHH
jgi:hypothetical protein